MPARSERAKLEPMDSYDGYFGPDTVTWRLHGDPLMLVAGLRALFLQALHPTAMAAVAQHSTFRSDPWGRFQRTGEYLGTVSYGTRAEADRASARVRGVHRRLLGVDPATGRHYRADDPDLLLWIHCGFVDSNLTVVRRGGLRVTRDDADAYVGEQVTAARLIGLEPALVPACERDLSDYYARMRSIVRVTDDARDVVRFGMLPPMSLKVELTTPARPLWAATVGLAFATLPRWARRLYRLPGLVGTDVATTVALRTLRTSLGVLPPTLREGPHLRAAKERLALSA